MKILTFLILLLAFSSIFNLDCKNISLSNDENVQITQETKDQQLFAAIGANNKAKVEELLKKGANPNATQKSDVQYTDLNTPLYEALFTRNPEIVELLLQHGADANIGSLSCNKEKNNCKSEPALATSILFSDVSTAKVLVKYGAKVEDKFIHSARDEKTVAFLVEHGVDINNRIGGKDSDTHLMRSAFFDDIDVVKALLKYGADIHLKNKDGDTALFFAQYNRKNDKEMVKIIKEAMKQQKIKK